MKSPTNARVLFLEDDADTRAMVVFILGQANIEVVTANTPLEAWMLANIQDFDLYLLDGMLNSNHSLELCTKLHRFAPHRPVIFYSGLGYQADIKKGFAAGASDYLVKPYFGDLPGTLLAAIRNARPVPTALLDARHIFSDLINARP